MVSTTCENCGGTLHWDWTEAFDKFGFRDGNGQVETWQVETVLAEAGYTVEVEEWRLHNLVISSIRMGDAEMIPYGKPGYLFGYDDARAHFPDELVVLLDREFPPSKPEEPSP